MCKPAFSYDNTPMAAAISESIHNERHRRILPLILSDGWTYERTAEAVDRTPRQSGRIIAQESPRLRDWISQKMS